MLKSFPALVGLVLLASLGVPRTAEARKFMLITSGDQIRELTPAPGAPGLAQGGGMKVGHVCSYGGLFWIDFWTWGGQYCAYKAENQRECQVVPPSVAAVLPGVPEDELPTPFFYRFPLGLVVLAGLGSPSASPPRSAPTSSSPSASSRGGSSRCRCTRKS